MSRSKKEKSSREQNIQLLQQRLAEAEAILDAIKKGEVDAFVVERKAGKHEVLALKGADRPYRILVETMYEGAIIIGSGGNILYANHQFAELIEKPVSDIIGSSIYDFILNNEQGLIRPIVEKNNEEGIQLEIRLLTSRQTIKQVFLSVRSLAESGSNWKCIAVTDLTRYKQIEREKQEGETKYQQLIELAPYGIFVQQDKAIIYANDALAKMLGLNNAEELLGKELYQFAQVDSQAIVQKYLDTVISNTNPAYPVEIIWQRPDETYAYFEIIGRRFFLEHANKFLVVVNDITHRKEVENKLHYLGTHDQLTGLPNRLSLMKKISKNIIEAKAIESLAAIIYLDIDNFSDINDAFGREVADHILQITADRLLNKFDSKDIVIGRLAGDEYIVLLSHVDSIEVIKSIVENMMKIFRSPYVFDDYNIEISACAGISIFPEYGDNAENLIKAAGFAMTEAKKMGPKNYVFCTRELIENENKRIRLEEDLKIALLRNELQLNYQPKVDINSGKIVGLEALARWVRADNITILPGDFIPVAERTGLIILLGEWVLEEACKNCRKWLDLGIEVPKISVNLSAAQLRQVDIVETIQTIFHKTRMAAKHFELELTESMLIRDVPIITETLEAFKKFGLSLSIDDFGVGYSSLGYLKRLRIDQLKIDISFVSNIGKDKNCEAIIRAVILLGHSLGLTIIAEGVETQEQVLFLKKYGCDQIQGFYISKALTFDETANFIKQYKNKNIWDVFGPM